MRNDNHHSARHVKFIPVNPLAEGVFTVYVKKGTLAYGLGYSSEKATPEKIKQIQGAVAEKLKSYLQPKYPHKH